MAQLNPTPQQIARDFIAEMAAHAAAKQAEQDARNGEMTAAMQTAHEQSVAQAARKWAKFGDAGVCQCVYDFIANTDDLTELTPEQHAAAMEGAVLVLDNGQVRGQTEGERDAAAEAALAAMLGGMTDSERELYEFERKNPEAVAAAREALALEQREDFAKRLLEKLK
jgi:hypothetical protein